MKKYDKLAKEIVKNVGGKGNVVSLRHCTTRLRFILNDEKNANDQVLKNMDGVLTVVKGMGEYMVVIGEHVPHVYEEVCKVLGIEPDKMGKQEEKPKEKLLNRVINLIMSGVAPSLAIICASGIIKGLTTLLVFFNIISAESGINLLLTAIGDATFYFIPMILGYNIAKHMKMDPVLGFAIGAIMCYPQINGVDINLFGMTVNATYTNTLLPVIALVSVAAPLYKFLKKHISDLVGNFLVPVIVLLIIVPLGFIVIGPTVNYASKLINDAMNYMLDISPLIGGVLLAGFQQVFILFGVHGLITIVPFMDLLAGNPSQILVFVFFTSFAQMGVVLAVYLKTKNKKLKSVALPAFISSIFGVTEPAIYGVSLPNFKMFIVSCIGSALSAVVVVFGGVLRYVYTGLGVFGLFGLLNPEKPEIFPIVLTVLVAFLFSFIVGYILFEDKEEEEEGTDNSKTLTSSKTSKSSETETIGSPVEGQVFPLSEAVDEAFACGALGRGVFVKVNKGEVYAPFDGTIKVLFPTKHAIGLLSENGCEMLIHVGYNTVKLDGKYFESFVNQGDKVKKGQLLLKFDMEKIQETGYSVETPVIITNSDKYLDLIEMVDKNVKQGDPVLTLIH